MVHNGSESSFVADVKAKQGIALTFIELKETVLKKSIDTFSQGEMLCFDTNVIYRMKILTHFIPVKVSHSAEDYAKLYLRKMGLGTRVKLSTIFHPHTNGQTDRTIQILEDMLRACEIDFKDSWDDHLPLIEFAYNNNYNLSTGLAPFEALYGRRCRSPTGWFEVGEVTLIGPELVHEAMEKVRLIRERLKMSQSLQKSYADVRRRDLEFDVNDWVVRPHGSFA
ncbi:hypothetical protein MTR67_011997 [Solanum verrucosum]|uniref:Integrase catalytic domain-containing protein n=1 Tax=Solanum verrucosum TaxID=315347 RepID=A0AAF0Q7W4_SOLVR|nr:hypothetical protein MTR67_011997 [Solanum verrucosum]